MAIYPFKRAGESGADNKRLKKWMVSVELKLPGDDKTHRKRKVVTGSRKLAETVEVELRKELLVERQTGGKRRLVKVPTVAAFAEEFMAHQANENEPSTLVHNQSVLDNHLIPHFGKLRLDQIDERMVSKYVSGKLEAGYKRATVKNHITTLTRMLSVARGWKLIVEQPGLRRPTPEVPPPKYLSFEEADRYLEEARIHYPDFYRWVIVAMRTGLRIGEMTALTWEDVNLERGSITVWNNWTRAGGTRRTKSKKYREIPLASDAKAALIEQWGLTGEPGKLVFPACTEPRGPNPRGQVAHTDAGIVMGRRYITGKLARLAKLAGTGPVTPHTLRHTFASHLVMRGVTLRAVQEWMGHHSLTVTQRYAHLAPDVQASLIEALASPPPAGNMPATPPKGRSKARKRPK